MSVVVAIKEHSRVYIGSDSQASNDIGQTWSNKEKMWKSAMNENIFIGFSGAMDKIEEIRYLYPFTPDVPDLKNVFEWLAVLREKYKDSDIFETLICGSSKIFLARGDGFIVESKTYEAIGSGSDIAKGALFATQNLSMVPEERIRIAITAAMTYDTGCGGNIVIEMI